MVNIYDGVNTAIRNAKRRMSEFDEKKNKPSQFDPGTTVYKLVEKLKVIWKNNQSPLRHNLRGLPLSSDPQLLR